MGVTEESRSGVVRVRKPPRRVPDPTSSEQLRHRFRVWALSWRLTAAKNASLPAYTNVTAEAFHEHVEYILGEDVFKLEARDANEKLLSRPAHLVGDQVRLRGAQGGGPPHE